MEAHVHVHNLAEDGTTSFTCFPDATSFDIGSLSELRIYGKNADGTSILIGMMAEGAWDFAELVDVEVEAS